MCLSKSGYCCSHCFFSAACCACRLALFILLPCLRLSFAWSNSSESELLLPLIVGHSSTTPRSLLYFLLYFHNRSPVSCRCCRTTGRHCPGSSRGPMHGMRRAQVQHHHHVTPREMILYSSSSGGSSARSSVRSISDFTSVGARRRPPAPLRAASKAERPEYKLSSLLPAPCALCALSALGIVARGVRHCDSWPPALSPGHPPRRAGAGTPHRPCCPRCDSL